MNSPRRGRRPGSSAPLVVDIVQDFLKVFPGFFLSVLIVWPQQIRGMIRNHHRHIAPLLPLPTQPHDTFLGAQDGLGGSRTQGADSLGADRQKLAEQELAANLHLVGLWGSILGRAALDYVADVNVATLERDALFMGGPFNHLGEELSGPADERQPLRVLVGPRAFAYKHQPRLLGPGPEHYSVPALMQATSFAVTNIFQYFQKIVMNRLERGY